jgi:nucleoside-diphosphate-sugar epimerase
MKILVTGSQGYIGTVLTDYLTQNGHEVVGTDTGYFSNCNLVELQNEVQTIIKDIRDINEGDLKGFDAIVHLAALSNDPVGELDELLTFQINYQASINLANLAKKQGIKRFVYISTQSIYGISRSEVELEEDFSVKNPQTAYAKSKWLAEQDLKKIESESFSIVYVRPSTVFGWSPRFRSDIVFNNLLVNGLKMNKIEVHSDGSPWRPIVHINDLCRFILIVLNAPNNVVSGEAFNVGVLGGNYTVKELAINAQECLPSKPPITFNTEKLNDPRSYKVSFHKALQLLGFSAEITMEIGGNEIIRQMKEIEIKNGEKLLDKTNRLNHLKFLKSINSIDNDLRYA